MKIEFDDSNVQKRLDRLSKNAPNMAGEIVRELGAIAHKSVRNNVPVDTGALKGSITLEVNDSGRSSNAIVGTNLEYARHVEYGTVHQAPQPYMRPGLQEAREQLMRVAKAVLKKNG